MPEQAPVQLVLALVNRRFNLVDIVVVDKCGILHVILMSKVGAARPATTATTPTLGNHCSVLLCKTASQMTCVTAIAPM